MLSEVEDAIVQALKDSGSIDIPNESIIVSSADDSKMKAALSSGGITVMYAGSTVNQALSHGVNLKRTAVFIVTVGRKMITGKRRISQDVEDIAEAVTAREMAGVRLSWRDDRFARVHNGIGWHDITFQATLQAV